MSRESIKLAGKIISSEDTFDVVVQGVELKLRPLSVKMRNEVIFNQGAASSARTQFESKDAQSAAFELHKNAIIYCLLEDDGSPSYTKEDTDLIREMSLTFTTELFVKIIEISGLVDNDDEKKE